MHPIVHELINLPIRFEGWAGTPPGSFYLMGCRSFEQFCSTLRSLIDPVRFCPFCPNELSRRNRTELHSTQRWKLLTNEYPHKATKAMWLIVPRSHLVHPSELSVSDWAEMGLLAEWCVREHHLCGGGILLRFGDPRWHAGTISHLHANVIEPMPGTEYRPPLAKQQSEHTNDYYRMLSFRSQLAERGGVVWLLSDKGIEETQPAVA